MKVGDLVQRKWSRFKGLGIVMEIVFNGDVEYARVLWNHNNSTQNHCAEGLEILK